MNKKEVSENETEEIWLGSKLKSLLLFPADYADELRFYLIHMTEVRERLVCVCVSVCLCVSVCVCVYLCVFKRKRGIM